MGYMAVLNASPTGIHLKQNFTRIPCAPAALHSSERLGSRLTEVLPAAHLNGAPRHILMKSRHSDILVSPGLNFSCWQHS